MKNELTEFEVKRNLYFRKIVFEGDFKQYINDFAGAERMHTPATTPKAV